MTILLETYRTNRSVKWDCTEAIKTIQTAKIIEEFEVQRMLPILKFESKLLK
jgi:hypothetical protein